MIDYARSLKFDQLPNYELLRSQIRKTRQRTGLLDSLTVEWHVPAEASSGLLHYIFHYRILFE
jgi:hypothetical protein